MTKTYASRYDEWADKIMQHVDVPDGLLGSSYHNDLCPSVMTKPPSPDVICLVCCKLKAAISVSVPMSFPL